MSIQITTYAPQSAGFNPASIMQYKQHKLLMILSDARVAFFNKSKSYADDTKKIAAFIGETLKPLGFKKRRNSFNKKLENGLVHQISIFSVGAYSIDHGKFYIHAGCYVPEAELYRKNVFEPAWVQDCDCVIRGQFPPNYLSIRKVSANLGSIHPHLNNALNALSKFENYDPITGVRLEHAQNQSASEMVSSDPNALYFETPRPIIEVCILFTQGNEGAASSRLQKYLVDLRKCEEPHYGHIEAVEKWALEMRLDLPNKS